MVGRARSLGLAVEFGGTHECERDEDHYERKRIGEETERDADGRDKSTREEGAERAGKICLGRTEGYRIAQMIGAHHFVQKSLPEGAVENVDHPEQDRGDIHHPYLYCAGKEEKAHAECEEAGRRLRKIEEAPLVDRVNDHAREGAAEKKGRETKCEHAAECYSRAGQFKDEPPQSNGLHPIADVREPLTDKVEPVITYLQRCEHAVSIFLYPAYHRNIVLHAALPRRHGRKHIYQIEDIEREIIADGIADEQFGSEPNHHDEPHGEAQCEEESRDHHERIRDGIDDA